MPQAGSGRTLFVNAATGDDSISYANNSASTPWRSIGRAAWGSSNRSAPVAAEAARAGDTVIVAEGDYGFSGIVGNRFGVIYNPVNQGTAGNFITFTCVGRCTLTAPNADSPVIGASGRNYVKWFADVRQSHAWVIAACGRVAGCGSTAVVNTTPDTGPAVCSAATGCWIEGAEIDGLAGIDYRDNWNGVRLENCTSCAIRNNRISNFTRDPVAGPTNHNQSILTMYGTANSLIEHNVGVNSGAGIYFKDTGSTNAQSGNVVRYNRFDQVNEVIAFSVTAEGRNYVYQNIGTHGHTGVLVTGGGLSGDWIFNNTFYRMSLTAVAPSQLGQGGRFWNNICVECERAVYVEGGTMVASSVLDLQHNLYFGYGIFYTGSDGNRSFSDFRSTFAGQEQQAPASIDSDPELVDLAELDFRPCRATGVPAASCASASPALSLGVDLHDLDRDGNTSDLIPAGAYVSGGEVIGIQR